MENKRSFSQSIRLSEDHVSLESPVYHILPYVSGGLERLIHRIKTDAVPELAEYGYHTNKDGHFEPVGQCIMGLRYRVKQKLDTKGHSAVLVLAEDLFDHKKLVVIKVLHSHLYQLGSQESHILWKLAVADPLNHSHTLRLLTTLTFDSHYCMVFEPLLPEPLTRIFQEFPTNRVLANLRKVGLRLLATVGFLHQQNMIHTDLKPENILLKNESDLDSVHIVDFGNAIHYVHKEVSLYYKDFELQTPLYRAPEVMFGMPFGTEIDMWSLGCILAELYTGEPLFFGTDKEEILKQIKKLLGPFPASIFKRGKFFQELKSFTTSEENQVQDITVLMDHLKCRDVTFVELLSGLLRYNPDERLTVREAACHPFFAGHFPVGFLLGGSSGNCSYSSHHISPKSYHFSPQIAASIKKRQPSSTDLLRMGTTEFLQSENPVARPKPIEILNERRKSKDNKLLKQKVQSPDKMHDDVIDNQYVKALMHNQNEVKLSDNVKEKMSSLLKAIRQEQDLVENDLERKSKETSVKEGSFTASYHSKVHSNRKKIDQIDTDFSLNHVTCSKVQSPKIVTQNKIKSPKLVEQISDSVPDIVKDTDTSVNLSYQRNYCPNNSEKQSPSPKGRLGKSTKINQIARKIQDLSHDDVHFAGEQESPHLKSNCELELDQNTFFQCKQRTEPLVYASQSHLKKSPDKPLNRKTESVVELKVNAIDNKFDKLYSDVKTPEQAKYLNTETLSDDEYVEMLSPYDQLSANKRHYIMRSTKQFTGSSPKNFPVRPKASVNADTRKQYLKSTNSDLSIPSRTDLQKFSENQHEQYHEIISDREENRSSHSPDSCYKTSESNYAHSYEKVCKESDNSARRKCYEKATHRINNLKHDEINFKHYNLFVRKRKSGGEQEHQKPLIGSRVSIDITSHARKGNYRNDFALGTVSSLGKEESNENSSHSTFSDKYSGIKDDNINCTNVRPKSHNSFEVGVKGTKLQNGRKDIPSKQTVRVKSSTLTPIQKVGEHSATNFSLNVVESPEIFYKEKVSLQREKSAFSGKHTIKSDDPEMNVCWERKEKSLINERLNDGINPLNYVDDDKKKSIRKLSHEVSNHSHLENTDELSKPDNSSNNVSGQDPYDFKGTPATDIKKSSIDGIGKRLQQKRDKVKKKARKSLVFRQKPNLTESFHSDEGKREVLPNSDCSDEETSVNEFQVNESNYQSGVFSMEKQSVNENCSGSREIVIHDVYNVTKPLQGRKRRLHIASSEPRKKLKDGCKSAMFTQETSKAVVKKSKLAKTFDTTYTIEFESPNHRPDLNIFK